MREGVNICWSFNRLTFKSLTNTGTFENVSLWCVVTYIERNSKVPVSYAFEYFVKLQYTCTLNILCKQYFSFTTCWVFFISSFTSLCCLILQTNMLPNISRILMKIKTFHVNISWILIEMPLLLSYLSLNQMIWSRWFLGRFSTCQ